MKMGLTKSSFQAFWVTRLPERFQRGQAPALLGVVWLLIGLMVLLGATAAQPTSPAALVPWAFAGVLFALQWIFLRGASVRGVMHVGLGVGLLLLSYVAWSTGGVYSPRMAWLTVIPMLSFYVISRRAGWAWLALCLLDIGVMAVITWHGWLPEPKVLGPVHALSSLASYAAVTLMLIVVLFAFDRVLRLAYDERVQRRQALQDKRQELLRTSQLRERFIASVSHELRNPMNAILGFNHVLLSRVTDKPEALKILNRTRQSADHLLTVINDVLDYSQLQAGKIKIQNETFALRETIHTAFELFAQRVQSMRLHYRCNIDHNVPQWVHTDRHRLMQILVNLLGNAIKFTHQGYVILTVHCQPGGVHFSVRDSGIGIAQAQHAHIFQRFAQAQSDTHARYGGNGLGLSITQQLVEHLGGTIGFESEAGKGALFWFTLPLSAVADSPVGPQVLPMQVQHTPLPPHFLVVDDQAVNRLLMRQILQKNWPTCHIVEADNGRVALDVLRRQTIDLVMMDMVMPEMDGIEATHALRQLPNTPNAQVPVLGLTANVNALDLERFTEAGVNATLLKPFDAAQVCAQIQRLLKEKKSSLGS